MTSRSQDSARRQAHPLRSDADHPAVDPAKNELTESDEAIARALASDWVPDDTPYFDQPLSSPRRLTNVTNPDDYPPLPGKTDDRVLKLPPPGIGGGWVAAAAADPTETKVRPRARQIQKPKAGRGSLPPNTATAVGPVSEPSDDSDGSISRTPDQNKQEAASVAEALSPAE